MRIYALTQCNTVPTTLSIAVDLPGWNRAQRITIAQLQTLIAGHAAVTLGTATNGLSISGQQLSLAVYAGTTAGAVPAAPASPHSGKVLNSLGGWTEVIAPPPSGGTVAVMKPINDIDYVGVGEAGAVAFNVTSGNPLGTATFYSGVSGVIRTASQLTADAGIKLGTGITVKEIADDTTMSMIATGKYIAITTSVNGSDKVMYVATYEANT